MSMNDHHHELELEATSGAGIDRRSFLKLAGFTFAGAVAAGCERPSFEKAIPYLVKPEEITPGRAYWYATTCHGCSAACGALVKNRDGRPIKMEGNPDHPVSRGGLCVVGQAAVLGLYDSHRLASPIADGKKSSWSEVDRAITQRLEVVRRQNGSVRVLTGTMTSPTVQRLVGEFLSGFADGKHVVYDPLSCAAILDAHEKTHGVRALPRYRFDKAEVIVSFDADFLGTWISPVEYTAGYRAGRKLDESSPRSSHHVQFESRFSLTGSKADRRHAVAPQLMKPLLAGVAALVEVGSGSKRLITPLGLGSREEKVLKEIADRLLNARGRSLVVCGTNDIEQQILTNYINHLLGNFGSTIEISAPSYQKAGNDKALASLRQEIAGGKVAALLVHGVNPVYDLPGGEEFADAMKEVPLVISTAERLDETASHAHFVCPDHHFLESWIDVESVAGVCTIAQPAIAPMRGTRSLIRSLAAWSGKPGTELELIKEEWKRSVFPRQSVERSFQSFWDRVVHDGFVTVSPRSHRVGQFAVGAVSEVRSEQGVASNGLALVLYPKVAMLDGRHAHNAWLQEVPDPITKVVWDNYASLSPHAAKSLNVEDGDVVRIKETTGGKSVELPVHIQVGQDDHVVAVPLGYGRKGTERFTNIGPKWFEGKPSVGPNGLVGTNAAPLLGTKEGTISYAHSSVTIEKTGKHERLATTQTYHSVDVPKELASPGAGRRPLIQQTTLDAYARDRSSGSFPKHKSSSMWTEEHKYDGHHWGMVIDLNACTGCSACVVSCQAENNIPVVGKDEVMRNREMHWLRIDRYYMENGENLDVAHQPMLCHHCDNAPCETVCPVLATVHNAEGLNQQVYNRCVGTRYCANNCPYKIRRFNWFDYPHEDRLRNMVFNPDVTVRSRGIMEKCSFCIQRIQEQKIEAKRKGVPLSDGAIKTACEQSCPSQAIVFGDMNDKESKVTKLIGEKRHYRLLTELEVRPSVGYMTIVRNRSEESGEKLDG